MKYHYQKPDSFEILYGERIILEHPIYKIGTIFRNGRKALILVQKRFELKYAYWDAIDPWLANDIYLHPGFRAYFEENATDKDYPIIPVRSAMWALRMKPLPKEFWEDYI